MLSNSCHRKALSTAKMLRDFSYCPRFCYLNWQQGEYLKADGFNCDCERADLLPAASEVSRTPGQALSEETLEELASMHLMMASADMPPPLLSSPKCASCSLAGICLPDESPLPTIDEPASLTDKVRPVVSRQVDSLPMYVQTQGAVVGVSGDRLKVDVKGESTVSARLMDISSLSVFGGVQITSHAIGALLQRDIPICHFTYGGWLKGLTAGLPSKNVELRIAQFRTSDDFSESLSIAKDIVEGKLRNCKVMLRRNLVGNYQPQVAEITGLTDAVNLAGSFETLLRLEGAAARVYFANFSCMLKTEDKAFDFRSRNRRPPRDPVNAVLSFLYAMLTKQVLFASAIVGFDPYLGFYHKPKYGRPALALDLAEEFRPIIADSVALTLINSGELKGDDFIRADDSVALADNGRRKVIRAFERRLDTEIIHPLLGNSLSYRRIIEVQARLMARRVLGELSRYPAFVVR